MSPEAVGGAGPNPLFDVWSLAVVLYEAIGGRNPFEAPTVTEVLENVLHLPVPDLRDSCADCHPEIAAFFKRALARDRTDRPDSAADLRNRLRRLRADLDANSD
jgi:serine/threonine-protein kinase